jgi:hypothetical protein
MAIREGKARTARGLSAWAGRARMRSERSSKLGQRRLYPEFSAPCFAATAVSPAERSRSRTW